MIVAGEQYASGPAPYPISDVGGSWSVEPVPFDRGLDSVGVASNGRVLTAGPTFGGWLGGTRSDATVLSRAAG